MRAHRVLFFVGLACCVALAACGGKSSPKDGAVPTTAYMDEPHVHDPYAVPPVIDAAYVSKVLNSIEFVRNEIRMSTWRAHTFNDDDRQMLNSIYGGEYAPGIWQTFNDASMIDHPGYRENLKPSVITVNKIITAKSDCIFVEITLDDRANQLVPQPAPAVADVALQPITTPHRFNPTPWMETINNTLHLSGDLNPCV